MTFSVTTVTTIPAVMRLVAQTTLTGTAQNVTFSGLSSTTDGGYYELVASWTNAQTASLNLFMNGDTTATNYQSQGTLSTTTTVSCANANTASLTKAATFTSSYAMSIKIRIYARNLASNTFKTGQSFVTATNTAGGSIQHIQASVSAIADAAALTSITLNASAADTFPIGATFSLYRMANS